MKFHVLKPIMLIKCSSMQFPPHKTRKSCDHFSKTVLFDPHFARNSNESEPLGATSSTDNSRQASNATTKQVTYLIPSFVALRAIRSSPVKPSALEALRDGPARQRLASVVQFSSSGLYCNITDLVDCSR